MKRGKYYIIWAPICLAVLWLVLKYAPWFLFWLMIIFLTKDLFVDLDITGVLKKYKLRAKKGSWPKKLEHAPLVVAVSILGIVGYVSVMTAILAFIDAIIDIWDDQR
ncbi:hypothetical protein COV93_01315 [Candidatus Woesearchaeota archaeon CG11_big_fil_rev_8_21_14_0_20_43_8]|nr:MAG: hypothetical protein COV93_01315 [Candidatus Woesearchaeota archaeon CG11_big_fil_rev_8_21_14_0_20_43_8]PIO04855.1 MAG: hypothetical protein COT47_07305 [Candidatus Woesearchaeota archaeon CG08_land_8_20_14_0_20_43_7]